MATPLRERRWTGRDGQERRAYEDSEIGASLPTMLLRRVAVHGDGTILRRKDRGIWKEITWAELGARARRVGMALKALGFRAGDVAAVLAETSPDWVYADLGILGAGGISVGIDPTDAASQVAHLLHDCGARFLFVENEEQLDKVLESRERCPALERIVIFDMTGLRDLVDPMCEDLETFRARGEAFDRAHPDEWESGIAAIEGGQTAILVYTSGTTGRPKGVMLNHRNILFQIVNASRLLDQRDGDERLAFLPMRHVTERIAGIYQALYTGTISNYVEGPETVAENLREVQPTIMSAVPSFWERFHSRIRIAIDDATWAQRMAYRWAIGVGGRMADAQLAGRSPPVPLRLEYALASRLVLRNVRRELGLDRVRWATVGAAPISPELIRWFLALGVDLLEVYGLTETAGLAAAMPADAIGLGGVGKPVPYAELALSAEGEILVRGEQVFQGYWNDPARTAEAMRDGWLHTGDAGVIEGGYVRVTERIKDIIRSG